MSDFLTDHGVVIALVLTILAVAQKGLGTPVRRLRGDPVRVVLAVVLVLVGLPWLFADIGFYIGHVPLLGLEDPVAVLLVRQVTDHPADRVHRHEAPDPVGLRDALEAAQELAAREAQLGDEGMRRRDHGRGRR